MIKVACISDTHSHPLPQIVGDLTADVLIIAGDWSFKASWKEIIGFKQDLKEIRSQFKDLIIVSGNHEVGIEASPQVMGEIIKECNVRYLCHTTTSIERYHSDAPVEGPDEYLEIFGTPYTPQFGGWAYMRQRGEELRRLWEAIPDSTEILVSHGPAHGILDRVDNGWNTLHVGCEELRARLETLPNLKVLISGHVHSGYGTYRHKTLDGRFIDCYGVSVVDEIYDLVNPPTVFYI